MTAPAITTRALAVLVSYDGVIRRNSTPEWDTVRAVAECRDGLMGAWGEVLDEAAAYDYPTEDDDAVDLLYDLFGGYQEALAREVAAREVTP